MNKPMAAAAILMLVTFCVHTFIGGPEVYAPLQTSGIDPVVLTILSVVWHLVTITLAIFSLAVLHLVRRPNPALALMIAAILLGYAAIFILYGLTRFGDLITMPQWSLFLAVPLLILWGSRSAQK